MVNKIFLQNKLFSFVCVVLVMSLSCTIFAGDKSFVIYDGTLFKDKPDLKVYGIQPLTILYMSALWPNKMSRVNPPSNYVVKDLASDFRKTSEEILCLDVEHWSIKGDDRRINLQKYKATIDKFKNELKDVNIGFYGLVPERNYWASIKGGNKNASWKASNAELMAFSESVDIIFPSLYTFYTNKEDWKRYAIEHLKEAKRYGKPVYAFLWPLYHESNYWHRHQYIGDDYWRLQLETVSQYADGIVLWGGWDFDNKTKQKWDESTSWWQVTKQFIMNMDNN